MVSSACQTSPPPNRISGPVADRELCIPAAMSRLNTAASCLEETTKAFLIRIAPMVNNTPRTVPGAAAPTPPPTRCELSGTIANACERLENINGLLQAALHQLEL